jgi:hypothetical protein
MITKFEAGWVEGYGKHDPRYGDLYCQKILAKIQNLQLSLYEWTIRNRDRRNNNNSDRGGDDNYSMMDLR